MFVLYVTWGSLLTCTYLISLSLETFVPSVDKKLGYKCIHVTIRLLLTWVHLVHFRPYLSGENQPGLSLQTQDLYQLAQYLQVRLEHMLNFQWLVVCKCRYELSICSYLFSKQNIFFDVQTGHFCWCPNMTSLLISKQDIFVDWIFVCVSFMLLFLKNQFVYLESFNYCIYVCQFVCFLLWKIFKFVSSLFVFLIIFLLVENKVLLILIYNIGFTFD